MIEDVIVITPFWKRPEVSKIYLENLKDVGLRLISACTVGDDENIDLCDEYAHQSIITHQNISGQKWNKALQKAKELKWEYVLILGSDDLVSKRYFEEFANAQMRNKIDYIGLIDAVALDLNSKKFRLWDGYKNNRIGEPIGCGRLIHRRIVEHYNYSLFPNVYKGTIDLYSHEMIRRVTKDGAFLTTGLQPYRVGLKSGFELSTLNNFPFKYNINLEGFYAPHIIEQIENYSRHSN